MTKRRYEIRLPAEFNDGRLVADACPRCIPDSLCPAAERWGDSQRGQGNQHRPREEGHADRCGQPGAPPGGLPAAAPGRRCRRCGSLLGVVVVS